MSIFIYGLRDPRTQELRYVGKTDKLLSTRLSQHISEAKKISKKAHRHKWILQVLKDGLKPIIEPLEETDDQNWEEAERRWIARFREQGVRLTNMTDGGEGPVGRKLSPEQIELIRKVNLGNKHGLGYRHTEETKRKMSESKKGKPRTCPLLPVTDETRKKLSEAGRGRKLSEETKQKIAESKKGKPRSEETREKLRKANLGKRYSDEVKKRVGESHKNPSAETRKKLSEALKGNQRALGLKHSEETKKKISEASKRSWEKRKGKPDED